MLLCTFCIKGKFVWEFDANENTRFLILLSSSPFCLCFSLCRFLDLPFLLYILLFNQSWWSLAMASAANSSPFPSSWSQGFSFFSVVLLPPFLSLPFPFLFYSPFWFLLISNMFFLSFCSIPRVCISLHFCQSSSFFLV